MSLPLAVGGQLCRFRNRRSRSHHPAPGWRRRRGAYDNAVQPKVPGGDGKTTSTDPGANGKGLGGGGGGGYSTDGQSFSLGGQGGASLASGGRPGNSYHREDLAAAAEAISLTISTGLMGAGVGAGLMAETRASAHLATSSRRKAARRT
jgi:hypothetical protein